MIFCQQPSRYRTYKAGLCGHWRNESDPLVSATSRESMIVSQDIPASPPSSSGRWPVSYVRALNATMDRAVGDELHAYARWLWALADQEMTRA